MSKMSEAEIVEFNARAAEANSWDRERHSRHIASVRTRTTPKPLSLTAAVVPLQAIPDADRPLAVPMAATPIPTLQPTPKAVDPDAAADTEAARMLEARFGPAGVQADAEATRILDAVLGPRTEPATLASQKAASSSHSRVEAAAALTARARSAAADGARNEPQDEEARRILKSVFG